MFTSNADLEREFASLIAEIDANVDISIRRLNSGEAHDRRSVLAELNKLQAQRVQELEPSFFKDLDRFGQFG